MGHAQGVGVPEAAEHDVYDSQGAWFGTARRTDVGAVFLRPPMLQGVRVMPPFIVDATPSSDRLAASLGAALSRALQNK